MQTGFIIILIFLIACALVALWCDFKGLVAYLLLVIILISMAIGFDLNDTYTTKKPMTPSLEIRCSNGKCDTSYVYKIIK